MPCKKYINIRLDPTGDTYVFVDSMRAPRHTLPGSLQFQLEAPFCEGQSARGSVLRVDVMRWPPGQSYNSPFAFSLSSQWPFGTKQYLEPDTIGEHTGRSFDGLSFTYDRRRRTLSWDQKHRDRRAPMQGSLGFTRSTPVWYLTLVVGRLQQKTDDRGRPRPAPFGRLLLGGEDIS